MNKSSVVWCLLCSFAASVPGALAEEKNGVQLTVQKKTLDRADTRGGYYYLDRIDRTQGLKVTVKNVSFKPMSEGEVEWTILVRKYSTVEGFRGIEPLKALRPADAAEMIMGAAQITGWRDYYDALKDKMEYQVIVRQGGVEKVRAQSTASFDTMAKRANLRNVQPAAPDATAPGRANVPQTAPAASTNRSPLVPAARPAATPAPGRPAPPQPPPAAPELPAAPLDGGAVK